VVDGDAQVLAPRSRARRDEVEERRARVADRDVRGRVARHLVAAVDLEQADDDRRRAAVQEEVAHSEAHGRAGLQPAELAVVVPLVVDLDRGAAEPARGAPHERSDRGGHAADRARGRRELLDIYPGIAYLNGHEIPLAGARPHWAARPP